MNTVLLKDVIEIFGFAKYIIQTSTSLR